MSNFKQELNTHKRNLIFFKHMVLNETYHQYLEMEGIFSLMKDDYSESGLNNTIEDLRALFRKYKAEYGFFPKTNAQELKELMGQDLYPDLDEDRLKEYFDLNVEGYTSEVIKELLDPRLEYLYTFLLINKTFNDAKKYDPTDYVKRAEVLKTNLWKGLVSRELKDELWDLSLFDDRTYEDNETNVKFPSSLSIINEMLSSSGDPVDGGYQVGCFYTFVAQAKAGKSTILGNEAAQIVKMGRHACIATFEMPVADYAERLNCCLFGISRKDYKRMRKEGTLTDLIREKKASMEKALGYELGTVYIRRFNNTHTQEDVCKWALNVENSYGIKVDMLVVDYINLLTDAKSKKNGDNTYLKIKSIAEDLRGYGQIHNWTTITATQTNRGGNYVEDIDASHVAESHALVATVDAMIGIISVKSIPYQRKLKLIASRTSHKEDIIPIAMDWDHWGIREFTASEAGAKAMEDLLNLNN